MKIGFNPGSIVDTNGAPLQGRVTVYVHDSLDKKNIYTLQASDYVASENPVLLDTAGRIPTTLFFDVSVVDVLVQRYIGEPGQMSDASPDTDFEDFDRFEAGFDFDPSQTGVQSVDTIADLKDIENPSGVVRVNCYTTPGDTFPRYYLWNPNCSASEDGGCVIADTHDASGKWCYLCESESIHSSVYGIAPGNETNINAFCASPLSVNGDYVVKYPASLYFDGGTYASNANYYVDNNRKMIFARNAKFTNAVFTGSEFNVDGRNHDYIADLVISESVGNGASVRSSWFRTAKAFFGCGASKLFIDGYNYFASYVIDSVVRVEYCYLYGLDPMLNLTFQNSSYLDFNHVVFDGFALFLSTHFYGKFTGCNFSDNIFPSLSPSLADFGNVPAHKLQVDDWKITDAKNPGNWLKWANAVGMTIVDLQGCTVSTLYNSNIQEFRNGSFSGGTVSTNVNVKFIDIGGSLTVYPMSSGKSLTLDHCDNVNIDSNVPFSSVVARDSVVVINNGIDNSVTSYSHDGGMVQATFKCAGWNAGSGTHAKGKNVILKNLTLSIGNFSWFDNVQMQGCVIDNPIHVIPYKDGSDLLLEAVFIGNTFCGNGYIVFGDSSVWNPDIYGVKVKSLVIKDNIFYTSGDGVQMLYFSHNGAYKYLAADVTAIYEGNSGSCPMEKLDSYQLMSTYTEGSGTYKYQPTVRNYWNLSTNAYEQNEVGLKMNEVGGTWTITPIDTFYLHSAEISQNNNQFDVQLAVYATEYASTPNASIRIFDDK